MAFENTNLAGYIYYICNLILDNQLNNIKLLYI